MLCSVENRVELPGDLRGRVPRLIVSYADRATLFTFCVVAIGPFLLLTLRHNGWLYSIASAIGPLLPSVFRTIRPFNPYRNLGARFEGIDATAVGRMPIEARFLQLFTSRPATSLIWWTGMLMAVAGSAVSLAIASFRSRPLDWSFNLSDVVIATMAFVIVSANIQLHFLLRWAFREWPKMR